MIHGELHLVRIVASVELLESTMYLFNNVLYL